MDWQMSTTWWLVAAALVGLELATGTFYLLMLALGAGSAAVVAHAGQGLSIQLAAAALVGGGAVALWHRRREHPSNQPDAAHNPDLNLDIGSPVQVAAWQPDGTARVQHRGAAWAARYAGHDTPQAGSHTICAVQGSTLLLDRPGP